MNDLRDTRKLVGRTVTDELGIKGRYAMAAQEAIYELLAGNPGVELATIRFRVDAEHPPKVTVTGRVGSLVGPAGDPGELTYVSGTCHGPGCGRDYDQPPTNACPTPGVHDDPRPDPDPSIPLGAECSSCHQLPGRPPTEYCRRPDLHNVNEDDPDDQPRPKMPCGCDGAARAHTCPQYAPAPTNGCCPHHQ